MRQMSLRLLKLSLASVLLTVSLSGCGPIFGMIIEAQVKSEQGTGDIKMEAMAPILSNDPVGAPLLDVLQDTPNFFAKFRGGPQSEEYFDFLLNQVRRLETARQSGGYTGEMDKIIAEYRAKGWLNDERAAIFRKLYMVNATTDKRAEIADGERLRNAQKYPKRERRVVGLPEPPVRIQPYKIGVVDELEIASPTNPAQKSTAAVLRFALPIPPVPPGRTAGADHIRRLLTTVFTRENGWKAETPETAMAEYRKFRDMVATLPPESRKGIDVEAMNPERRYNFNHNFVVSSQRYPSKYGISAAELLSITFEDWYDDLGFIWVQFVYLKPQE